MGISYLDTLGVGETEMHFFLSLQQFYLNLFPILDLRKSNEQLIVTNVTWANITKGFPILKPSYCWWRNSSSITGKSYRIADGFIDPLLLRAFNGRRYCKWRQQVDTCTKLPIMDSGFWEKTNGLVPHPFLLTATTASCCATGIIKK